MSTKSVDADIADQAVRRKGTIADRLRVTLQGTDADTDHG